MRNPIFLFLTLLFLSSCAIIPQVSYEKTNASLIQKSINNLNTLDNLKSKISKSDKIVIVGVEDYKTSDYSLLATLEDEIIKEFVMQGYKVLERDDDMVYRLFSEESSNYKYINRVKSFDRADASDASGSSFRGSSRAWIRGKKGVDGSSNAYMKGSSASQSESSSYSQENYNQEFPSSLQSADKIISYRVIESGIVYDYNEKDATFGEVEREARTILEVRLTDAKTSEIISAITLDGKANDFVKETDIQALENFSYRYYRHTLPKIYGSKRTTVKSSSNFKVVPWVAGTLGFIVILSILGSG